MLCRLVVVQVGSGFDVDTGAAEVLAEVVAEIAAEFLVVRLDRGFGNLVRRCVVVQAGSGFDIDTGAAEAAAEAAAKVAAEIVGRTELDFDCGSGDL